MLYYVLYQQLCISLYYSILHASGLALLFFVMFKTFVCKKIDQAVVNSLSNCNVFEKVEHLSVFGFG